jgi:uncharacterized protein (DUF58 family)
VNELFLMCLLCVSVSLWFSFMPALTLNPDVLARASTLGLKARGIVEGLRIGEHKSPFRGFSVEFVQHREYVPGDDIRHIDWKSYGRSERYTIKQYEQETNFIGHILLDASRSMLYGDGTTNKLEYAKLLTASLAYLVIHQRDSASLHVCDDRWRVRLPPSSQLGHLKTILRELESCEARDKTAVGPLLADLAGTVRRRGLVFVVSDCLEEVDGLMQGLRYLRLSGHEVTVFHVLHPDELTLPLEGMIKFDGLEEARHLLTRPHLIRPSYLRVLGAYLDAMRRGCESIRADYVLLDTGKPLAPALGQYLAARLRVRRL